MGIVGVGGERGRGGGEGDFLQCQNSASELLHKSAPLPKFRQKKLIKKGDREI
jgi:hypothetical protein